MNYVEDLRHTVGPTLRIADEALKRAAREELARDYLPTWGTNVENQLTDHPFVGGDALHVVDIKLYMIVRWFASGTVDHVPPTVFDHCAKLKRVYREVGADPGVKAWLDRATR